MKNTKMLIFSPEGLVVTLGICKKLLYYKKCCTAANVTDDTLRPTTPALCCKCELKGDFFTFIKM